MLWLDIAALSSETTFARIFHLAFGAHCEPFLLGAAHLPRIVDVTDTQHFLGDPDAQRHQRFAAFNQRAVRRARLLDAAVDQVAQFQQREPLPLDFEDEPLNGLLVAGAPPGAQFGERGRFEGWKAHCSDEKVLYICTVYPVFLRNRLERVRGLTTCAGVGPIGSAQREQDGRRDHDDEKTRGGENVVGIAHDV
ncbi:hypothetical protein [Paraburkholderia xenovorans]